MYPPSRSVIDDCKLTHLFANSLSACVYKLIACKLHNSLFVSFPKRKLRERYRTAVQYIAKFRLLPRDLSFVLTNFLWLNKTSKKNRPLFKRIIARYAMKFHVNFRANFRRKITGTKNEIHAFRLHYFCTVLYPPTLSQNRKPRSRSNLDLVRCLEDLATSQEKTKNPEVQVIILDGRSIANMLRPGYAKKTDYASQVSVPAIYCIPNTACKPSRRCLGRVSPRNFRS